MEKRQKLKPFQLLLKEKGAGFFKQENSVHQSCITNHLLSEFRLPKYYTSKEYLKYCLENELSMKLIYLQIPTLYLASSDILPHTQDFPSCICLKHVSYERFVDHTLKEVPQFNIKILSVKRFSSRPAVPCC